MRREKHEKPARPRSEHKDEYRTPPDFWNRIADDAAHGYGAEHNRGKSLRTRLNEDQLPGDNERG